MAVVLAPWNLLVGIWLWSQVPQSDLNFTHLGLGLWKLGYVVAPRALFLWGLGSVCYSTQLVAVAWLAACKYGVSGKLLVVQTGHLPWEARGRCAALLALDASVFLSGIQPGRLSMHLSFSIASGGHVRPKFPCSETGFPPVVFSYVRLIPTSLNLLNSQAFPYNCLFPSVLVSRF